MSFPHSHELPSGIVDSVQGRTGDVILTAADIDLGNVDNTSDVDKPISTLTQAALDLKATSSELTKSSVGLNNVDNTSDANKPVSTAQGEAIAAAYTATSSATLIHGLTAKTSLVDADEVELIDSAASNVLKKITWANTKTAILTGLKDVTGSLVGLTNYKINFKNAANTFTSYFSNTNTASREYTFPDRDGIARIQSSDSGWIDILPVWTKDDGSNGWAFTSPGGSRLALSASNSNAAKTLVQVFHIPHEILIGQSSGYYHVHWEAANANSGNVVLHAFIAAGLRDGTITSEYDHTITFTPSSLGANKQGVIEVALNSALIPYLTVDALFFVRLVRDRGIYTADTYNSTIFVHTCDMHVEADKRPTTSKDPGAGWVKI